MRYGFMTILYNCKFIMMNHACDHRRAHGVGQLGHGPTLRTILLHTLRDILLNFNNNINMTNYNF